MKAIEAPAPASLALDNTNPVTDCDFAYAISLIFTTELFHAVDIFDVEVRLGGSLAAYTPDPPGATTKSDPWEGNPGCELVYWGSGLLEPGSFDAASARHIDVLALRGPLSASDLRCGARVPLGDPALLLPALYAPRPNPRFAGKSVCVPQHGDVRSDRELQDESGCELVLRPHVKPTLAAVGDYLDALHAADFVLSAHGASASAAIAYGRPFAFWGAGSEVLSFELADAARLLSIPAQAVASLEDGQRLYQETIRARLVIPSLWPLVARSPHLLRAEGVLRVLQAELARRPAAEREAVLCDHIAQLAASRAHFGQIERQLERVVRRGRSVETRGPVPGSAAPHNKANGRWQPEVAAAGAAVPGAVSAGAPQSDDGASAVSTSPMPDIAGLSRELSMARAALEGARAETLVVSSRLSAVEAEQSKIEQARDTAEDLAAALTNRVAALQREKLAHIDTEAHHRAETARLDAAESTIIRRAQAEMRIARGRARRLPSILLSPTTKMHLRHDGEIRLICDFLSRLPAEFTGVAPDGREDRVLKYVLHLTDHVADFPLLRNLEYREMYPDVAAAGILPLVHWLLHGRKEGRNVHPLCDTGFYTQNVPAANAFNGSPAEHYLKWGVQQQHNPHPLFETAAYLARYGDVAQRRLNPLCHFLQHPRCTPHWLFDPNFYLNENPDVALTGRNALSHFLLHGWREGRNPHLYFNTRYYLKTYPDVAASGMNPLLHFVLHGALENRRTTPDFDPEFYLRAYADIAAGKEIPLRHFVMHGHREGRVPRDEPRPTRKVERIKNTGRPIAVMIDAFFPRPDRDSGSIDQVMFARIFQELGYDVHYISVIEFNTPDATETADRIGDLEQLGIACITSEHHPFVEEYYFMNSGRIEVVFASRVRFGAAQIAPARALCPQAKIVFNTVDLHFLREEREGRLTGSKEARERAEATKREELDCMRQADATIVISAVEKEVLAEEGVALNVHHVPMVRDFAERARPGFDQRQGVGFLGGFRHQPNIDAVEYLIADIWPRVQQAQPGILLEVIGADMPPGWAARKVPGVTFVGYIEDLDTRLDRLKATIAPLRFGAGAKGKVVSSMGAGVPVIASTIAAEGMQLTPGDDVIVAETAADYVDAIVALDSDRELWERLSRNGLERVHSQFSFDSGLSRMRELLTEIGALKPSARQRAS